MSFYFNFYTPTSGLKYFEKAVAAIVNLSDNHKINCQPLKYGMNCTIAHPNEFMEEKIREKKSNLEQ